MNSIIYTFFVIGAIICLTNAQSESDAEFLSRALDSVCNYDADCKVTDAYCQQSTRKCMCKVGYKSQTDKNSCYAAVGAICNINGDADCAGLANSECVQGTCACKKTHIPHPVSSLCVGGAQLKETCLSKSHCLLAVNNTECINSTCQCDNGFRANGAVCIHMKGLYMACSNSNECIGLDNIPSAECQNGICECAPGYVVNNEQKCVSGADQVVVSMFAIILMAALTKFIM